MKAKAVLTAAIVSAACLFSSCGDNLIPAENNFSQMLSADSGKPVFVSVNLLEKDNEAAVVKLGTELTSYSDELVSALTSAKLSENPDSNDLPGNDTILLQIEILRNDSEVQKGMDNCFMEFFKDGTLRVFGTEQFCGAEKSYALSSKDLDKIKKAAEQIVEKRTNCPPPMRITDPLSSYAYSGAMVAPAGITWDCADSGGQGKSFVADALHPLDAQASNVKVNLYSGSVMLGFPYGFEPDNIKITGWDISQKGDTSPETLSNPKSEYENNISSAGDFTEMFQLERSTVYQVTVFYDSAKRGERGFSGSADYYFETGEINQ